MSSHAVRDRYPSILLMTIYSVKVLLCDPLSLQHFFACSSNCRLEKVVGRRSSVRHFFSHSGVRIEKWSEEARAIFDVFLL